MRSQSRAGNEYFQTWRQYSFDSSGPIAILPVCAGVGLAGILLGVGANEWPVFSRGTSEIAGVFLLGYGRSGSSRGVIPCALHRSDTTAYSHGVGCGRPL